MIITTHGSVNCRIALYALVLSILFAVVKYAIVVDGIGAVDGIKRGSKFF